METINQMCRWVQAKASHVLETARRFVRRIQEPTRQWALSVAMMTGINVVAAALRGGGHVALRAALNPYGLGALAGIALILGILSGHGYLPYPSTFATHRFW